MYATANPRPDANAGTPDAAPSGDAAQTRAIARAVRTEIHWLMPAGRTVTITVDGDDIAVHLAPGDAAQ